MIWVVQFLEKQQLVKSKFISKDVMLYKIKVLSIFKAWNSVSPLDWASGLTGLCPLIPSMHLDQLCESQLAYWLI